MSSDTPVKPRRRKASSNAEPVRKASASGEPAPKSSVDGPVPKPASSTAEPADNKHATSPSIPEKTTPATEDTPLSAPGEKPPPSTPEKKTPPSSPEKKTPPSTPEQLPPHSRYEQVLARLPKYEISSWKATQRLVGSLVGIVLSFHALTLAPVWALPICWFFAAVSMCVFFEIGNDCAGGRFFPSNGVNNLIGLFFLASVFQPMAYWKRNNTEERRGDFTKSWRSLCNSFSFSHLIVLFFAAIFFPLMIYNVGWWGLIKYWMIPFTLFQIGMTLYVKAGAQSDQFVSHGPLKLGFSLRSYLRYSVGVPSYRMSEAVDMTKRMWNRASLDSSETPAPSVQELLDNPAYFSLRLGYFNNAMAYTAISTLLVPLACYGLVYYTVLAARILSLALLR